MKHLRHLLLSLIAVLVTFSIAFADSYDSETATLQKASDKTVKVLVGSKTYTAPISFDDGASWTTVKDHYEVDPSVVTALSHKKITVSIAADGTASFHFKK